MKTIDLHFYPGWTRKSMTFTIDDGNVKLDRKFLDITEPAGLKYSSLQSILLSILFALAKRSALIIGVLPISSVSEL